MGNYRFRFSDMMPNAWFYKLKDMGRTRKQYTSHSMKKNQPSSVTSSSQKSHNSQPRYSYYFNTEPNRADRFYNSPINPKASDTHFPESPRKSSKRRTKRKTIYKPSPRLNNVSSSVSAGCSCHATLNSAWTNKSNLTNESLDDSLSPLESSPESLLSESDDDEFAPPQSGYCNCKVSSSSTDIIIDMENDHYPRKFDQKIDGLDTISELELPPILTKPAKFNDTSNEVTEFRRRARSSVSVKMVKEESFRTPKKDPKSNSLGRKSFISPAGIKLRANSPRIASKKIQAYARRSVSSSNSNGCLKSKNKTISESLAIIKSSLDPQRDFRDSMMEMIVENNIRASKDLEDLLACYLTLNSNEYHDIIIKAFEQIWSQMTNLRL